jgi:p-aminobenzoyl-glutamate transporter AbgT
MSDLLHRDCAVNFYKNKTTMMMYIVLAFISSHMVPFVYAWHNAGVLVTSLLPNKILHDNQSHLQRKSTLITEESTPVR